MIRMISKLFTAFAVVSVAAADGPGLGASLTQEGISEAKVIIAPYIFKNLVDIEVPEVDFDGGSLKNIKVSVPQPDLSNINVNLVEASNGVELAASGITITADADFTFKYSIIKASGTAKINIKNAGLDAEVDMSTQPGTELSTELAPSIKVGKLDINVDPNDVDIKLEGGLVTKIASILIPLLKNTVIPQVIDTAKTQATTLIDTTVEQDLAEYGIQQTIPYLAGVTFDYAQMGDGPKITDGVFAAGLNGTFFDAEKVEPSQYHPSEFALHDPKGKQLQAYLADYVLNTAFSSGYETQNTLDITYLLKTYLNLTVTTDNLGVVVPEILTKYGAGKAVGLSGKFAKAAATSFFKPTGQTLDGSLLVTVTIDGETAIEAEFDDISAAAKIHSETGKVFGSISKATLGTIGAGFKTTLGLTSDALLKELQDQVDSQIATANADLSAGIVIPKILGVDVSDVELNFFDGYLALGLSVNQAFWLAFKDRLIWAGKEIKNMKNMMTVEEPILFLQN